MVKFGDFVCSLDVLEQPRHHRINSSNSTNHILFSEAAMWYLKAFATVTKVTDPISDFAFLSTAKSGKSRIKIPFLDSPKGAHPKNYFWNVWNLMKPQKETKKQSNNVMYFFL